MVAFMVILIGVLIALALHLYKAEERIDASMSHEGVPEGHQPDSDGPQGIDRTDPLRKRLLLSQWETTRDRYCISRPARGSLAVKPIRKRVRKGEPSLK